MMMMKMMKMMMMIMMYTVFTIISAFIVIGGAGGGSGGHANRFLEFRSIGHGNCHGRRDPSGELCSPQLSMGLNRLPQVRRHCKTNIV